MPTPRTPAPSRIGKSLGAILSNPRRETPAVGDDVERPAGTIEPAGDPPSTTLPPHAVTQPAATPAIDPDPVTPDEIADTKPAGPPTPAEPAPPAASTPPPAAAATSPVRATARPAEEPGGARRKKRETFLVPEDLAEAMRNAIVHLSGPPLYYTLAEFGEHAIRSYIAQLEREHNAGRPFPPRPRAVRQGRPLR